MDKSDARRILVFAFIYAAVTFIGGGYLIWRDSAQIGKIIRSENGTFGRTTFSYGYVMHINNDTYSGTWDIKAGKGRSLKRIVENSSNVNNLNKFKEAVDELHLTRINLILYLLAAIFIGILPLVPRNREKTYDYGFIKGMSASLLGALAFIGFFTINNCFTIISKLNVYYLMIN